MPVGHGLKEVEPVKNKGVIILIGVALIVLIIGVLWMLRSNNGNDGTPESAPAADGDAGEQPAENSERDAAADETPSAGPRKARNGGRRTPLQLATAVAVDDESLAAGAFEGVVVSWSTGEVVSGAELTWAHGEGVTSSRSDEEGRFLFEPTEPGVYELAVVTAEGFLPFAPEWGFSPIRLVAREGVRLREIVLSLRPAIDYQGQVVDPEGQPVAGAEVIILSMPGGQTDLVPLPDRFRSDDEGRFTFHAPDNALLEASHAGFTPGTARLDITAQVSHRLVIRLRALGEDRAEHRISGRVVSSSGDPVADALVVARSQAMMVERDEDEPRRTVQGLTNENGEFDLGGLTAGQYRVTASHSDYASARITDVEAGTEDVRLELVEGATLRGEVRHQATGEPVAGFSIVLLLQTGELTREPYRTATVFDGSGTYEIIGLGPGEYEVMATARDFAPAARRSFTVPSPPPSAPITQDFDLSSGGRLTGRVIDSESREPLEHARVSVEALVGSAGSAVPLLASTTTDGEGRFEIRGLNAGLRSVFVAAFGHHSRIVSGLEVSAAGDVGPITVDLRPVAEGETPRLELSGIGVVLEAEGDALIVGRMISGGGASEAGLRPGDGILDVDGEAVVELGFQGSIERIRGPEGSTVRLRVRRNESGDIEEIAVSRRRITTQR